MAPRTWLEQPAGRWALAAAGTVVAVHAVAGIALLGLQRGHDGRVLVNVEVDDVPVGGLSADDLVTVVADRAEERLQEPILLRAGDDELEVTRTQLGAGAEAEPAVAEAWDQGRRGFWLALRDQLAARWGATTTVDLRLVVDDDELARSAADVAATLSQEPRAGALAFEPIESPDDVEIDVARPRDGHVVDPDAVVDEVADWIGRAGTPQLDLPVETAEPEVTDADVDAALAAELAISAPVTLGNPFAGADLDLVPTDLATVLAVAADPEAPEGERLRVTSDADRLGDHLGEDGVAALEDDPVDATIELVDGEVRIQDGADGFEVDLEAAATLIVELATQNEPREGELPGDAEEPDLGRDEAEGLGVEEEVSSFTTDLVPGQPRNTNIQLGADILDGALILPGERFSLNEAIGPRTADRGFVENGFIDEDGELISVVGGGSSQLGTTFMNAAWFAGIDLVEFQPHSFYFSRYPMGREATLSYNQIDVVVENDSPYGILVATSSSESSVTISFWSTSWAEVETWTGEPTNVVPGAVRDGFDVSFGRSITYPDGSSTSEEYAHRYQPEN